MLKIIRQFILLMLFSILTAMQFGCSLNKKPAQKTLSSTANNKLIEQELVTTAQSIERSLAMLAMTQEANNPPLLNTAPLVTPEGGMGGPADIDWTGPIEPLLNKLAAMCDYNLKVLGNEPAVPIIVSITQNKAIIADILKNASLQAGKRATVMVFPANKIVELRYSAG